MGKKDQKKSRILIIDDHPLFREGLKAIIGKNRRFKVAGEAGNARDGLDTAKKLKPDLITMDLALPDQSGIELTGMILDYLPETNIIVISMHCKIDYIVQAIQAGAKGYLLKESATENLIKAFETLLKGEYFLDSALSSEVAARLMDSPYTDEKIRDAAYGGLTSREQEILRMLAEGIPRKDIASKLCISVKTVENHATKIMKKLSLHSQLDLVRYAARMGLIDVDLWKT
jgi:DNA-binding NarL/FixJ family response regulator